MQEAIPREVGNDSPSTATVTKGQDCISWTWGYIALKLSLHCFYIFVTACYKPIWKRMVFTRAMVTLTAALQRAIVTHSWGHCEL